MKYQDFIRTRMGFCWVMSDLRRHGPSTLKESWHPQQIRQLHERGLIRKSTSVLNGWEITDAGRKALEGDA